MVIKKINKKRNKKGFTLIELVVVIAILGILTALAIPRLTGSRDSANRSAVLANLRIIESAITIAEANGCAILGKLNFTENVSELTDSNDFVKEYFKSEPKGPGKVVYGILKVDEIPNDETYKAVVNFKEGSTFKFVEINDSKTWYTLEKLSLPAEPGDENH